MNDFDRDNAWQKRQRDSILLPQLYKTVAFDGRYVVLDKGRLATIMQKRDAVDTVLQMGGGNAVFVEEKIVRWPGYEYSAYTLETKSCTRPGRESDGWMVYGNADALLYAFQTECGGLKVHTMNFSKLKEWFWANIDSFDDYGPLRTLNATMGKKVPIAAVRENVGIRETFLDGVTG